MTESTSLKEKNDMGVHAVNSFLNHLQKHKKLFYPSIEITYERHKALFIELGGLLLEWAKRTIGHDYEKTLADGYSYFVVDVNKSQMRYEHEGKYPNSSYDQVSQNVYHNQKHMLKYHWGVYVTAFVWEHHLRIYQFFKDHFLEKLTEAKTIIDFGSGSGIWGLLVLHAHEDCRVTGLDISEISVKLAQEMSASNGFGRRSAYMVHDALIYKSEDLCDAGISCFLMEHLETPQQLLNNVCANLKKGGYAFVTCALTAAEVDHIYEFRHESDVFTMAEKAGFRVIASFSSSPDKYSQEFRFLPRSMALVLQKRHNDIW